MEESLFTRIIKGEIPCHKIYEDDKTFAFLDIYPVQPGHVLVIPKTQVEFVWDLPDDYYQALMVAAQKIAVRQREVLGSPFVGEKVVGVDVPHAHVHLIPFTKASELDHKPDMSGEPDHGALAAIAARLAF